MLSEIRLFNYKTFVEEKISLQPISVFIGPNGSGKSTIASALHALSTALHLGLFAAFPDGFFSFWNMRNFDAKNFGYRFPPIGLGVSGNIDSLTFDYDILFTRDDKSKTGFYINYEGIKIHGQDFSFHYMTGKKPEISFDLPTYGDDQWIDNLSKHPQRDSLFNSFEEVYIKKTLSDALKKIRRYMRLVRKNQFQASSARMQCAQYDGSGRQPFLKPDASNLAEVIQYLQEEQRGLFVSLKEWVIKYAGGANKIVDLGVATYEDNVFLNFFEEGKQKKSFEVRGPLVSDGYWVFTAFACLASSVDLPSIAFFEEPESHLHPHKLPILYDVFKEMACRKDGPCQVLISSHSPYFLDLFKESPESVIFLSKGKATRLTDIDNYEKILQLYSLGEAWYSNVFNWGNPK